ncbi:MAG: hypothetical protein ACR2QK_21110, partial [Acidimicrobiales bacterium]
MNLSDAMMSFSLRRPRLVLRLVLLATVIAGLGFVRLQVDTDPENMLPADDPVRLENAMLADTFGVRPTIVVGLFGPVDNVEAFAAIDRVHEALTGRDDVVADASYSVGSLLDQRPTADEVATIVTRVQSDPVLAGNVLFDDEPGAALFIALSEKGAAGDVAAAAEQLLADEPALVPIPSAIAGQPLAEDAFGRQMFIQMAIFAPLAGLLVFLILYAFFRRLQLV